MIFIPIDKEDIPFVLSAKKYDFFDVWDENMLLSAFESGRFFGYILEDNEKKVGFITFDKSIDEADIEDVFVFPEFRNKGYAKALVGKVIEDLKKENYIKVFLEVRESNTPARKAYEGNGFIKISERKKYYNNGENAIVYIKEL